MSARQHVLMLFYPSESLMKLLAKKIAVFLLLVVFLAVSLGNAFGFVACETGCLSDIHCNNHTPDHHHENEVSLSQYANGGADTCLDYLIPLTNGIKEESVRQKGTEPAVLLFSTRIPSYLANTRLSFAPLYPEVTLRISQSILSHRTVVLLH